MEMTAYFPKRTCERCGAGMSPWVPRRRINDQLICRGCEAHMPTQAAVPAETKPVGDLNFAYADMVSRLHPELHQHIMDTLNANTGGHYAKSLRTHAHDSGDGETIFHCFEGSTRYWTRDGIKTLAETVGTVQQVLVNTGSGGVWREAIIHSFGEQPLWRVTLRRNKKTKVLYATPEHRWLVRARTDPHRAESRTVTTTDLRGGDRLAWLLPKSAIGSSVPSPQGIAHGIVYGDGTRAAKGSVINLWGEKDAQLIRYFTENRRESVKTAKGVEGMRVLDLPAFFKERPSLDESVPYLYGWLAGYFAADGSVNKQGQAILCSASRENLEFAQVLAARLGIGTFDITTKRRRGYTDSDLHSIQFIGSTLRPEFFLTREHRLRYEAVVERGNTERIGWTVERIEPTDRVEEVFCPRVAEYENFVLDGWINTRQCPFCGSGAVTAGGDGTVSCDYCKTNFTVQVQPEFNAFPQTVDGKPYDVPGMPDGQSSTEPNPDPNLDPNAAPTSGDPGNIDPNADPLADDAAEAAAATQAAEDNLPEFLKKSHFITAQGAALDSDSYLKHLAIRFADEPMDVLAAVRAENNKKG